MFNSARCLARVRRIGVEAAETAVAAEAAAEAAKAAEASETAEAAAEASETAEAGERGQVGLPRSWRVCMCEGRSATRNPRKSPTGGAPDVAERAQTQFRAERRSHVRRAAERAQASRVEARGLGVFATDAQPPHVA